MEVTKLVQADTVADPENAVCKDRHQTIYSLSVKLNVNIYIVHVFALNFLYDKAFSSGSHVYRHTCKEHCLSILLEHEQWYCTKGDCILQWIVVDNEMWQHHFEVTGKPADMQLRHIASSQQASASKVIFIVLFDSYGPLLLDFK